MDGIRLLLDRPDVAETDCNDCCKYQYRELSGRWQPVMRGKNKEIRRRPFDCPTCPKIPLETREQLVPLGIRFGPERAIDVDEAAAILIQYHEVQAGAPYPTEPFQSRLYGMIHYMLWQEQHQAQTAQARTPALLRRILERG